MRGVKRQTVGGRWVASLAVFGGFVPAYGEDVSAKLADLEKQREKVKTLHLVATQNARSSSGSRESTVEIWERLANGKRQMRRSIKTKVPATADREAMESVVLMVNDGVKAWREMPPLGMKRMVFTASAGDPTEFKDIRKLLGSGEGQFRANEEVIGQPCVVLEVKSKGGNAKTLATYWISERYGVVLKSVVEGAAQNVTEMRVTELTIDEPMEDGLFKYVPPADAEIIDSEKLGRKKGG